MDSQAGPSNRPLELDEYERYGRQMILPSCGLKGQIALKNAVVGVVGAGGLGCPVLQYLAGAGVGTIHIYDHDTVSISNLHRQILHTSERVGMNKADSAKISMLALNPLINVITHPEPVLPSTAISLLRPVDIVIDCTDRPLTRYLLNDAAVRLGKPLVSGAAMAGAGQWAVYGGYIPPPRPFPSSSSPSISTEPHGPIEIDRKGKKRACYRCTWPSVLPGSHGRCEDLGVWGFVTGLVGTGMAGEVVKLITGNPDQEPLLHLYHLGGNPLLRTIRLKPPSPKCIACGPNATLTDDLTMLDYDEFCGGGPEVNEDTGQVSGGVGERVSASELQDLFDAHKGAKGGMLRVVDTRSSTEFEICHIPSSSNIPLADILKHPSSLLSSTPPRVDVVQPEEVVFVCKQGNDSQLAAASLRASLASSTEGSSIRVRDLRGGLRAWKRSVDPSLPMY